VDSDGLLDRRGQTKEALAGGGRGERRGRDAPLGFRQAGAHVLARRNVGEGGGVAEGGGGALPPPAAPEEAAAFCGVGATEVGEVPGSVGSGRREVERISSLFACFQPATMFLSHTKPASSK